jgi:iron complex transport system ATP-binding protein
VLGLVRRINREVGTTVVMVLHDLSLAARYSDRLVVIGEGRILADGDPTSVLEPAMLQRAFGLRARVLPDPVTGTPLVVPELHQGTDVAELAPITEPKEG